MKGLQRFIDEYKIDTIISFGENANILNILTKRKKVVLSIHISLEESLNDKSSYTLLYTLLYKTLIKILYKKADIVTCVSDGIAKQLTIKYLVPTEKVMVIYNLSDVDTINKLATQKIEKNLNNIFDKPTIINIGSLCYQKGQEFLIRSFALTKKSEPILQLVIIGRGELLEYLENLAKSLGVRDSVHFLGFKENPFKYLSKAKIFVSTSRFEGFPNVLVESMICGVPIISTDCNTGPKELLGNSQYGILLPNITDENREKVEKLISEWIIRLMNPNLWNKYREKSLFRGYQFDWKNIIPKWINII